ncbi:uncharacterized protein LOC135385348 [Ornithodoros turicata]|uniref:uncharacterized protein LOC135385348 n=1 Tax=Ornithodoros turicata TaxID=34597 RepID=UPI003139ED15
MKDIVFSMSLWLSVFLLTLPFPYEGKPTGDSQSDREVCTSEACHRRANAILSSLTPDLDPCEDFYEFVCTGWKKDNPPLCNVAEATSNDVMRHVGGLLEDEALEGTIFRNVRAAYKSCTNEDIWQEEEVHAFQNVLNSAGISSWPLWPPTEQASDWQHLYASTRVGLNMDYSSESNLVSQLFNFIVMRDLLFPAKYAAFLFFRDEDIEGIEAPCYTQKERPEKRCPEQTSYYHMLSGTTKDSVKAAIDILNGTISEQDAEAAAEDIIGFEVGLAQKAPSFEPFLDMLSVVLEDQALHKSDVLRNSETGL